MKIINLSKKIIIAENIKEAETLSDKILGLLKKTNPRSLIFKTRFGIHTFFLKESIDVIILDKDLKVVKLKSLEPNKLFFWNPKYNLVLELPKGTVQETFTKIGDTLGLLS